MWPTVEQSTNSWFMKSHFRKKHGFKDWIVEWLKSYKFQQLHQVVVVFLVCENRQDGGIPGMEAASLDELKKGLEMHWCIFA